MHKIDPRTKILLVCLGIFLAFFVLSEPITLLGLFLCVLLMLHFGNISVKEQLVRNWYIFTFLFVLVGLPHAFFGNPRYIKPGLVLFYIWNLPISLSLDGLGFGIAMTLRAYVVVTLLIYLALTTRPRDLANSLRVIPYYIGFALSLCLRYIPTLMEQFTTTLDAQKARGLELEKGNVIQRVKKATTILMPILVNTLKLVDQMAIVMEARGLDLSGKNATTLHEYRLQYRDYALILTGSFLTLGVLALRLYRLLPGYVPPFVWD